MSFWSVVRDTAVEFGRWMAGDFPSTSSTAPRPPARDTKVTAERAMSLSTIYRGVLIHATAGSQLSINVERNGEVIPESHQLVIKPDTEQTRSAFIEYTIVSLYLDGNAFWKLTKDAFGRVINITPLNPNEVTVNVEWDRYGRETITYGWRNQKLTTDEVRHLQLLRIPGLRRGLGPIQAAQLEVLGALDARDYGAMWLSDSAIPDGILSTEQELAPGDSDKIKNVWYGRNQDGTPKANDPANDSANERVRVLGKGFSYTPIFLKPSDVQFLETQQYSTIQMARLIGAPASIMLVAVEGNSETYTNVEQEWIGYVRFSLMKPLREIEEALTSVLPGKQTARFNVSALLRTDTKTRYEAHSMALDRDKGWMVVDEIRSLEGLPKLTDDQRAELAARATRQETANV